MTDHKNRALISVKVYSNKGLNILKAVVSRVQIRIQVEAVSSVYRVHRAAESLAGLRDIRNEEILEGLAFVMKVKTNLTPLNTLLFMNEIEQELQKEVLRKTVSLNLMIYESEIIMLPGLALPHPEMHLRPEEVIPAVELWPEYVHPVLNSTLLELSRRFIKVNWGEFFTQSEALGFTPK